MAEPLLRSERRTMVDKSLTEISLFAKALCPEAKIETTMESFADEDGHVRMHPPAGLSDRQLEELEGKLADRCVGILLEAGVFLCSAVYDPSR
jgi:hypothetical protein